MRASSSDSATDAHRKHRVELSRERNAAAAARKEAAAATARAEAAEAAAKAARKEHAACGSMAKEVKRLREQLAEAADKLRRAEAMGQVRGAHSCQSCAMWLTCNQHNVQNARHGLDVVATAKVRVEGATLSRSGS